MKEEQKEKKERGPSEQRKVKEKCLVVQWSDEIAVGVMGEARRDRGGAAKREGEVEVRYVKVSHYYVSQQIQKTERELAKKKQKQKRRAQGKPRTSRNMRSVVMISDPQMHMVKRLYR